MFDASGEIKKRVVRIWYIGLDKQKISYPDHSSTNAMDELRVRYKEFNHP